MSNNSDVEVEDQDETEESLPLKYSISSYGADYPVDSVVKRIKNSDIIIPSFQRGYVWTLTRASRFIESLLLGLPVPGIFLARDLDTNKLLVIDGQQRLKSLQYFYDGHFEPTGQEFTLKGVQSEFEGKSYQTLLEEDRRRLDDSIIHATVIKQDEPKDDDSSSVYHVFERLNTGGVSLQPQEIRASISRGAFNDLIKTLNKNEAWRSIYSIRKSPRMKDQELILRFFALYFRLDTYKKPLKGFLNTYMHDNRRLKLQSAEVLTNLFTVTITKIYECIDVRAFRPRRTLNAAVFDAVMVGVARRLAKGDIVNCEMMRDKYENLLQNPEFITATDASTDERNVERRITLATEAFADIE
ncbi:MAG: DUF262 domain-containing protein [Chloroflexaceae bacterium]|nr:DUF262 domain-containing protein [Chloroflexaceae bacterium]NJO04322.1 DUF262 domain-containing protein [Chloroflexaceae bacterium]